jgi:UDP-2-acetamido-3-amino-2,3-dideoxy-glucuronate N-acetyltransferase
MIMANKEIAVIGCGYWGKNLVRNFYELGMLNTICDKDENRLNDLKDKFPGVNIVLDFHNVLKSSHIKAVAIATPATTHYDLAKKALLNNKDVFIEKPLATNIRDAEELVRLAEQKNRILMVGHILQYHSAVIKLKELITKGEFGRVQYIYSNRLNIGKLRTEENILWSFAPHDLSVILMLLEEEPQRVSAFGGDYINRGIYDTTLTTLDFKNGVKAHIFVSWLHPYKEQKLIVIGSKAMAVFDDISKEKLFIYPHKIEWKDGLIPIAQKAQHKAIPIEEREPLKEELRHFIDCVLNKKRPRTDGYEGLKVLRILEAAEESFRKNKI